MKSWLLSFLLAARVISAAEVRTERVPEGGVQPQIVSGADGFQHLVYLKGPPGSSDLRYASKKTGAKDWSAPVTVNSNPGSAVAIGTIRGGQIATGKAASLHVVWNGPGSKDHPSPLLYSRSLDGGRTFEPQRDLRASTKALDGGASVAASANGDVFIIWHGAQADAVPGEINRRVFVLKSTDNGQTFAAPQSANDADPGVCPCCSLKAFVAPGGELITLYRAARSSNQRDVTVMTSKDGGATFQHRIVGPWAINACPMSSASVIANGRTLQAAWEAESKVFSAPLDATSDAIPLSTRNARHPSLASNSKGEVLVTWSTGTGWQKGGSLAWALLDPQGKPTSQKGTHPGVPIWGFTAAYASGNDFVVMY